MKKNKFSKHLSFNSNSFRVPWFLKKYLCDLAGPHHLSFRGHDWTWNSFTRISYCRHRNLGVCYSQISSVTTAPFQHSRLSHDVSYFDTSTLLKWSIDFRAQEAYTRIIRQASHTGLLDVQHAGFVKLTSFAFLPCVFSSLWKFSVPVFPTFQWGIAGEFVCVVGDVSLANTGDS